MKRIGSYADDPELNELIIRSPIGYGVNADFEIRKAPDPTIEAISSRKGGKKIWNHLYSSRKNSHRLDEVKKQKELFKSMQPKPHTPSKPKKLNIVNYKKGSFARPLKRFNDGCMSPREIIEQKKYFEMSQRMDYGGNSDSKSTTLMKRVASSPQFTRKKKYSNNDGMTEFTFSPAQSSDVFGLSVVKKDMKKTPKKTKPKKKKARKTTKKKKKKREVKNKLTSIKKKIGRPSPDAKRFVIESRRLAKVISPSRPRKKSSKKNKKRRKKHEIQANSIDDLEYQINKIKANQLTSKIRKKIMNRVRSKFSPHPKRRSSKEITPRKAIEKVQMEEEKLCTDHIIYGKKKREEPMLLSEEEEDGDGENPEFTKLQERFSALKPRVYDFEKKEAIEETEDNNNNNNNNIEKVDDMLSTPSGDEEEEEIELDDETQKSGQKLLVKLEEKRDETKEEIDNSSVSLNTSQNDDEKKFNVLLLQNTKEIIEEKQVSEEDLEPVEPEKVEEQEPEFNEEDVPKEEEKEEINEENEPKEEEEELNEENETKEEEEEEDNMKSWLESQIEHGDEEVVENVQEESDDMKSWFESQMDELDDNDNNNKKKEEEVAAVNETLEEEEKKEIQEIQEPKEEVEEKKEEKEEKSEEKEGEEIKKVSSSFDDWEKSLQFLDDDDEDKENDTFDLDNALRSIEKYEDNEIEDDFNEYDDGMDNENKDFDIDNAMKSLENNESEIEDQDT